MTSAEVRSMSDDELLDMDYFFHEFDDINDDEFWRRRFYIFLNHNRPFSMPAYRRASFIQECSVGAVSYKVKILPTDYRRQYN